MTTQDLVITPVFLIMLTLMAYLIRPILSDQQTRGYFIPALWLKFVGAISVGLIYQFYYNGGDTFNYFTNGSQWIWQAFWEDPYKGFQLLFGPNDHSENLFEYWSKIWYYKDDKTYFIVRIAAFFDLFTLHTYSSTALFFAFFSFIGSWKLFVALSQLYPRYRLKIATAIFFVPSVIFWGSGILKDSITFGALAFMTFCMIRIVEQKRYHVKYFITLLFFAWIILQIKVYILVAFAAAVAVWLYLAALERIMNTIVKVLIAPLILILIGSASFMVLRQIGETDQKYALENIPQIAALTAYDIRYGWGARTGGDAGYDLGTLDGTWTSMVQLFPAAVNVSLFRPYLWEVRNPLMLLSALEATLFLLLTIRGFYRGAITSLKTDPFLVFCLVFSVLFAFAVGVSTYNFGTLMRYKIPMMPFFILVLFIAEPQQRRKPIPSI